MRWKSTTWASQPIRRFDSNQIAWIRCPNKEWHMKKLAWLFDWCAKWHGLPEAKVQAENRRQSEDARELPKWRLKEWAKQKRIGSFPLSTCSVESNLWIWKKSANWPERSATKPLWWAKNEATYRSSQVVFAWSFQIAKKTGNLKLPVMVVKYYFKLLILA